MKTGGGQTTTTTPSGPASTYLGNVLAQNGQPDYTAVNNATSAANAQQWNQFYNSVIPQLNQRATFLGNPTGAIKDLNSAVTNMANNQNWNAQQANLNEYNLAQTQGLEAANLDGRTQTTTGTPGSGATLASILGGGLGLAGLYNTLFPSTPGSGNTPGLGNSLISGGKSLYNYLTGASAPTAGFGAGIAPTALGAPADSLGGNAAAEAGDYFTTGAGAAPAAAATPTADAALGAQVASDAQATSIAPEFAGYSASAGSGAGLGAGAGADAAGAAGAGAAGDSGAAAAGAGLGVTAGALAAGGIAAAPILAGMLTNPVSLTGKYWEGLSGSLSGSQGPQAKQAAEQQIISMIATGGTKLPPAIDAYAKANGLYQAAASLNSIHAPMGGMSPTRLKLWQQ